MDYAIIKSGKTNLLKVIILTDWPDYEWEDFNIVRERESGDIKWFEEEEEAIAFMMEHFDHSMIEPQYFQTFDKTGDYYIG